MAKIISGVLFAFFLMWAALCITKVPAGNVGVKVYLLGSDKGVDVEELGPGRYWIGFNEDLFLFPTFTQTDTWTSNNGASISFQTSEGLDVDADIGISYAIQPSKAAAVFQKYRKGIQEISDLYLRNMVKDAFVTIGGTKPIEAVYGEGKAELIASVEKHVRDQVSPLGINVERVYWAAQPRLPKTVVDAINAKISATQKAQQRENEIQQAKAEAQKTIEEANGKAQSIELVAKAESNAIRMRAQALQENQKLVELTLAERWDGKMPQVTGGTTPLIDLRAKP